MAMKVEYINPFIESTHDLFATMLGCKAARGEVDVVQPENIPRDIVAIIGLSGMARGMVALTLPVDTAMNMANRLLSTDIKTVDDTVSDAIAEMVNMVAGGAKAKLSGDTLPPFELSLPNIVRGNDCNVDYPSGSVWLEVPFNSELGSFSLRVTIQMDETVSQ